MNIRSGVSIEPNIKDAVLGAMFHDDEELFKAFFEGTVIKYYHCDRSDLGDLECALRSGTARIVARVECSDQYNAIICDQECDYYLIWLELSDKFSNELTKSVYVLNLEAF